MFSFLHELLWPAATPGVAQSIFLIAAAIALGTLLGRLKIAGISLGSAGVLFAGLLLGHFHYQLHPETMQLLRDFGLILFVYAIGLQVGPSFFASLRSEGLLLNGLAIGGVILSFLLAWLLLGRHLVSAEHMMGLLSGSVTNTPSMGAAKNVVKDVAALHPTAAYGDPAAAYAVAYPFGAVAQIIVLLLAMRLLRIHTPTELQQFEAKQQRLYPHPASAKCRVVAEAAFGQTLAEALGPVLMDKVVVTRLKPSGSKRVFTPAAGTVLNSRDVLMMVGLPEDLQAATAILGRPSTDHFIAEDEHMETRDVTVTRQRSAQQSIGQLHIEARYGVKITRIFRAGMELVATPGLVLHMGDTVRLVGPGSQLRAVEEVLGNSPRRLAEPELATIFLGIMLGLILGSVPLAVPGIPVPVKLGLAAGPLLVAILISRYGGLARLHSYMNQSAAWFMRDLGISLFFATVGIGAGGTLVQTFVHNNGWLWLGYGMLFSLVPSIIILLVARFIFRLNFLQLAGLIGGLHTSPPTLAFCHQHFKSDVPAQAYATVFPLVTIFRILAAQLFLLLFMR